MTLLKSATVLNVKLKIDFCFFSKLSFANSTFQMLLYYHPLAEFLTGKKRHQYLDQSSTKRAHPKSQGQDIILTLQRKVQLVEQHFTQHTRIALISQAQIHYLPKKQARLLQRPGQTPRRAARQACRPTPAQPDSRDSRGEPRRQRHRYLRPPLPTPRLSRRVTAAGPRPGRAI